MTSSLTQGLSLLGAVIDQERRNQPGLNASRLAEQTGIERSRVSRLSRELRAREMLQRDETAALAAGSEFFRTASALNAGWLRASRPALRSLSSGLGVHALITVANGPRAMLLRYELASDDFDRSIRDGLVTPIWCTGAGRALLWDHSASDLRSLLDGVQFSGVGGPHAPRSVDEVHDRLERDREAGVISADQEYDEGVDEYAVPIRHRGAVIASLAVRGRHRSAGISRAMRSTLLQLADELSVAADAD